MHSKIFILVNSEEKKFGRKSEILANFFWLRIGWNENFIMQLAYCDKNLYNNFFSFIIEKFDFPVKMPWEKEVLWIYSFGHNEIFSFYHFWIPQCILFSKNIIFYPGTLGWNYCHFRGVCGCLDTWPNNCKQTPSLRFPIRDILMEVTILRPDPVVRMCCFCSGTE